MAIHIFSMIYKNLKAHAGERAAMDIFPEHATLPDKMNAVDQVALARRIMDRMDNMLDRDTVIKVRHGNTCNLPKEQKREMTALMAKCENIHEFLISYGYVKQEDNTYLSAFEQQPKCWCSLFRTLDHYEPISITWCECCNGHHEKGLLEVCRHPVKTEIIESIASGGRNCITRVTVL